MSKYGFVAVAALIAFLSLSFGTASAAELNDDSKVSELLAACDSDRKACEDYIEEYLDVLIGLFGECEGLDDSDRSANEQKIIDWLKAHPEEADKDADDGIDHALAGLKLC